MKPITSSWPVCGRCCEVAPFGWFGEPHRCVQLLQFDGPAQDGMVDAIDVAAAHDQLAREVRRFHFLESRAALSACLANLIPQRPQPAQVSLAEAKPPRGYGADSITIVEPEPEAARAWILANRIDPSEIYREHVLDRTQRNDSCLH